MKSRSFSRFWIALTLAVVAVGTTACVDPQVKGIEGAPATTASSTATTTATATPTATPIPTPTPIPPHTLSIAFSAAGAAGGIFAVQPTVQVKNLSAQVITSGSFSITLTAYSDACITPVASSLTVTKNPVTTVSGVATFSGAAVTKTTVTHLGASDGTISVCSSSFSIAADVADHLAKVAGDGITANIGCTIHTCNFTPITVQVLDRYNNPASDSVGLTNLFGSDGLVPKHVIATSDAFGFVSFQTHLGSSGVQNIWQVEGAPNPFLDHAGSGNASVLFTENLAAHGNGTFNTHVDMSSTTKPIGIAIGDINEDGIPDLLVVNQDTTSVFRFLGLGDGTFSFMGPALTTGVGMADTNPFGVAMGDFNRDGHLDLAITNNGNGNVTVYLGRGDGTFAVGVDYNVRFNPTQIITGDVNNDGFLDLIVVNNGNNSITVLTGKGDGTFNTGIRTFVGSAPTSVASGDFNGDGILDLAVTNYNGGAGNTVSILLGVGDGTFSKTDFTTGTGPISVTIGDFNRDGKLDLAIANDAAGTLSILAGKGDGTFRTKVDNDYGVSAFIDITTGDVNGDGVLDLIGVNGSTYAFALTGNGDGTFNNVGPSTKYSTGSLPGVIVVGDFNADGKLDIVTTNTGDDTVSILIGN